MASMSEISPPKTGIIWLVGAGPGDPDLLTLRAAHLVMAASVIVHDGLVDPRILEMAPPSARLISVAKRRARHTMPQDEINALLIHEARQGHDVIRLKGGDPFIFGRGGEELESARAAGVAVQVVPGISAAIGAAAAAQMPLTHRDSASVVSFVAGQCKGFTQQNWAGLAGHDRSLVIYMGLANVAAITAKLLDDGLAPDTPCAVVENAARPEMRVLRAALADFAEMIGKNQVQAPALLVIGAVTATSDLAIGAVALEAIQ
jgi:uroporphyrin-III C-methyltransferase